MDIGYPRKNIKDEHFHINNNKNIIYINIHIYTHIYIYYVSLLRYQFWYIEISNRIHLFFIFNYYNFFVFKKNRIYNHLMLTHGKCIFYIHSNI